VSAVTHEFDALEYLHAIPAERVQQIHLAGTRITATTWSTPTITRYPIRLGAVRGRGAALRAVSTMIERDDHIPPLAELCAELAQARALCARTLAAPAGAQRPRRAAAAGS